MTTVSKWNKFQEVMLKIINELKEIPSNGTRTKILCAAIEATLIAPAIEEFIFPSDIKENLSNELAELSTPEGLNPEIQEKVVLMKFWLDYYCQTITSPTEIEEEVFAVMEMIFAIYSVKKRAIRTTLIDSIFNEANEHIAYLASQN
ncbi:MAG: hypothetical protein WCO65_03795 [bacterium]